MKQTGGDGAAAAADERDLVTAAALQAALMSAEPPMSVEPVSVEPELSVEPVSVEPWLLGMKRYEQSKSLGTGATPLPAGRIDEVGELLGEARQDDDSEAGEREGNGRRATTGLM